MQVQLVVLGRDLAGLLPRGLNEISCRYQHDRFTASGLVSTDSRACGVPCGTICWSAT